MTDAEFHLEEDVLFTAMALSEVNITQTKIKS